MKYLILVGLLWCSIPVYSAEIISNDPWVAPSVGPVETPQKPIKQKSKKEQREERRIWKQKRRKSRLKNVKKKKEGQQANVAWNNSLTLGIAGLCGLLGIPILIASLVGTSFLGSFPAILFILLLIPFGIIYLTLAIAIAVILSVGISDLQKGATPESNTASIVAIMSTVYLVLLAIGCLFFSSAGLILLYVQFLLMIPGVIGLIFGLMKIKSEIDR